MESILTVVTPSDTYDLTTLDRVKLELSITDTSQDEFLTELIHDASATFADLCNRVLVSETVSETFRRSSFRHHRGSSMHGQEPLMMTRYPVTDVASITEDDVLLDPSLYEVSSKPGFIFRLSDDADTRVGWWARKIVVVYTGGYVSLTTLPRAIEAAVLTLTKNRLFSRTRDPALKSEEIFGVAAVQYWVGSMSQSGGQSSSTLPPDVADAVNLYRDIRAV